MIYLDASYLVRLYYEDPGFEVVRNLAMTATAACAQHGRAEVIAALHRKYCEGSLTINAFRIVLREFADEIQANAVRWLPLSQAVLDRIHGEFETLPRKNFLRASDAIHLVTAAENGFRKIYSNDTNLLAAAAHSGLRGVNVIY
jgi:predicted nucleic acid-binding protein